MQRREFIKTSIAATAALVSVAKEDPGMGFVDSSDFFKSVVKASKSGAIEDKRLRWAWNESGTTEMKTIYIPLPRDTVASGADGPS